MRPLSSDDSFNCLTQNLHQLNVNLSIKVSDYRLSITPSDKYRKKGKHYPRFKLFSTFTQAYLSAQRTELIAPTQPLTPDLTTHSLFLLRDLQFFTTLLNQNAAILGVFSRFGSYFLSLSPPSTFSVNELIIFFTIFTSNIWTLSPI